ncbi:MAG TPA: hypothetical protein VHC22_32650 [Pirellulales bacterium]|nr:hypothetical protein [Pirellulales bacterium]
MTRRFQFRLRTLLAMTTAVCLGIAGLSCSWRWFSDNTGTLNRFLLQFCGGLALAGGAFGSLLAMPFRRPIACVVCGLIAAVVLPVLAVVVLFYLYANYGPRC